MPILWGKKAPAPVLTCPSCQSPKVLETERHGSDVLFRCTICWWPFLVRTPPKH